jgi:hypothetical protein
LFFRWSNKAKTFFLLANIAVFKYDYTADPPKADKSNLQLGTTKHTLNPYVVDVVAFFR